MVMRKTSRFFILLLSVIFCITVFSSSAYASVFPSRAAMQRFGAWVASALTAMNITIQSVAAPIVSLHDFLADPFQISDSTWFPVDYTYEWDDNYFDLSTISISDDVVTIDGIDYYDVWLSHDAANKFRVNAFDIENAWDIVSESEGTFVSGAGYLGDVPIFDTADGLLSQNYVVDESGGQFGDFACHILSQPSKTGHAWRVLGPYGFDHTSSYTYYPPYLSRVRVNSLGQNYMDIGSSRSGVFPDGTFPLPGNYYVAQPFDFDWVAGTIPADPLGPDDGLHWYVPSNPEQWLQSPDTQQIIDDVIQYFEDHPDIGPGHTTPMVDPTLSTQIDDLIDLIMPIIPIIQMQFGPEGQQPGPVEPIAPDPQPEPFPDPQPVPYPDPDPQPGTPISDLDWSDLFDVLKNIWIRLTSIDVSSMTISNVLTELRNRFEYWFDDFRTNIQNLGDTILQDIEKGPIIRFRRALDKIKQIFLPVLLPLKTALGIWHYVVDWLGYISAPFVWILGIGQSGYSMIMAPIYACVAGTLCIAVYRKFGR